MDEAAAGEGNPFDLPVVAALRAKWLTLGPGVTFLVGENGSGKSTLVEGVAIAAGLHVSRVDGSPLIYNERDEWLPDFLVCRKELAQPVLDALWK